MVKHTMKVYTLSIALSDRDPTSAYNESIGESLEKVRVQSIIAFHLDWS